MKETKTYQCEICFQKHDSEQRAIACEQLGYPEETAHIKEGDEIKFFREQHSDGTALTYFNDKGVVLYKFTTSDTKQNKHRDIMVCLCKDEKEEEVERQVLSIDLQKEGDKLYSPIGMTFKKGWAAALRAQGR